MAGLADSASHVFWTTLGKIFSPIGHLSVELLLVRDLHLPIPFIRSSLSVTIRQAVEDDLSRITRLYASDPYLYVGDAPSGRSGQEVLDGEEFVEEAALQQYRDRLLRGERCFIAAVGGQIAHLNWLCRNWGEAVLGYPLYLRAGEVYTTDALTMNGFRGKNIHALVLAEMLRVAQREGADKAFTVTRVGRRNALAAFEQLGWRLHGKLLCIGIAGRVWLIRLTGQIDPLLRGKMERLGCSGT